MTVPRVASLLPLLMADKETPDDADDTFDLDVYVNSSPAMVDNLSMLELNSAPSTRPYNFSAAHVPPSPSPPPPCVQCERSESRLSSTIDLYEGYLQAQEHRLSEAKAAHTTAALAWAAEKAKLEEQVQEKDRFITRYNRLLEKKNQEIDRYKNINDPNDHVLRLEQALQLRTDEYTLLQMQNASLRTQVEHKTLAVKQRDIRIENLEANLQYYFELVKNARASDKIDQESIDANVNPF